VKDSDKPHNEEILKMKRDDEEDDRREEYKGKKDSPQVDP